MLLRRRLVDRLEQRPDLPRRPAGLPGRRGPVRRSREARRGSSARPAPAAALRPRAARESCWPRRTSAGCRCRRPARWIASAVCTLRMPGSTTAIMASTPRAEARPMCSRPASMSRITSSGTRNSRCCIRAFSSVAFRDTCSPCRPTRPCRAPAVSRRAASTAKSFGQVVDLGVQLEHQARRLGPSPRSARGSVAHVRRWARGTVSAGTPRAAARLPSGSASTAITGRPCAASRLAKRGSQCRLADAAFAYDRQFHAADPTGRWARSVSEAGYIRLL